MNLVKRNLKRGFTTLYGEGSSWANTPAFQPGWSMGSDGKYPWSGRL